MDNFDPQAEAMLQQAVAECIRPIAHMEKQYSGEQMQKMILDYAGRAAKRKKSSKAWTEVASDFTYSFFESLWKVFGESAWLDQVDLTWVVVLGFRTHLSSPAIANVSEEEFNQEFAKLTPLGLDCSRYYSWSAFVLKKIVTGKASQKTVRNAADNCREELLKQTIGTAEEFAAAWIKGVVESLGKDVGHVLPQHMATQLFESYVKEGGGIPLWLMNAPTPEVMNTVQTTIQELYANIPGGADTGKSMGGKGMGGKGMGGKGMADPWGAYGGGMGGCNPYAAYGYAPY